MKPRRSIALISVLFLLIATVSACAPTPVSPTPTQPGPAPAQPTPTTQPYPAAPTAAATAAGPASAQPSAYPAAPSQLTPGAPYGKEGKVIGNAFIQEAKASYDSATGQPVLAVSGDLPTPCHTLQTQVNPPDDQKNIKVQVFSLVNSGQICTQVTQPFETSLPLGKVPSGAYKVWVNDKQVGDVTVP